MMEAVGKASESVEKPVEGKKEKAPVPNCLSIYQAERGGIKFEYIENPVGYLQQCLNNGKWYHVQIYDPGNESMKPLTFPDEAYYNPKELAQVIGAEPWRRFFERQFELLEKISPYVFLGAMGIIVLALIIFAGS